MVSVCNQVTPISSNQFQVMAVHRPYLTSDRLVLRWVGSGHLIPLALKTLVEQMGKVFVESAPLKTLELYMEVSLKGEGLMVHLVA
jgi:hypothetical protein